MIKSRWHLLSSQEKRTLLIGILLCTFFLFYELIWSPLNIHVQNLRHQIPAKQELLTWMQESDQRISYLQKKTLHLKQRPAGSLISIIQNNINKSNFASNVTQLQQTEGGLVQLHLQEVNFDSLATWLINLGRQENIAINQISVIADSKPGLVEVELVLQ